MAIDILSRYDGKEKERRWQTASCWLYPGQCIAIVDNGDASIDSSSEHFAELLDDLSSIVDTRCVPSPGNQHPTNDETVAWAKRWLDFFLIQDENCA